MIEAEDIGAEVRIRVVLSWHDSPFEGEATGPRGGSARLRLVGEATLRAVEHAAEGRVTLDLTAVGTTPLGDAQVALAQVYVDRSVDGCVGSAMIRHGDPAKATARAVLDAINRRLESVLV